MLQHLSINNYALIKELSVDFSSGLSIITGETGAGKSILLGALGLVLGNRADSNTLLNKEQKCIVEAEFSIVDYGLRPFFVAQDLDYEPQTILRREILPSGKSRAFVNDSPVTLQVLNDLKTRLIDIHSQHQTLQISDPQFQLQLIDAFANNETRLASYQDDLKSWQKMTRELEDLIKRQREAHQQFDYNQHLFQELEEANLVSGEQEELERQLERLNNIEEIQLNLSEALNVASDESMGVQNLLYTLQSKLKSISTFSNDYQELYDRVTSLKIELDDVVGELEHQNENIDFNPNELTQLNDRLQLIYNLQKKHYVGTIEELQQIHQELADKVDQVESAEGMITEKREEINQVEERLHQIVTEISSHRKSHVPKLIDKLQYIITDLGMPQGRFDIQLSDSDTFLSNGKDELTFLFSANKGGNYGELKRVASGGELSRIMLAIKKVLSENSRLSTIIFDEIDTGVSGEISNKMAKMMNLMSQDMQVITITHLPQIAAKGNHHYKVYKEEVDGKVQTNLKLLSNDERIVEIAEMLSGKDVSDSAIIHAKELLN